MTLQENNTGLVQESKDHGRHFQAHTTLCPSHLNLEAQQKQGQRHRTATDTNVTYQHTGWPTAILHDEGKGGGKKEGKSAIDQICLSHPPTSCFNPLAGTSYITVPLFHLERDADLKQRLRDPNHLLVESKTDCIYIKNALFVCLQCFIIGLILKEGLCKIELG